MSFALLLHRAKAEGRGLRSLYQVDGRRMGREVLALFGVLLVAGPVAQLPNIALATALFGDAQPALQLFVQPLPPWAAVAGLMLLPLSIALTELPTYYADALPRLEARGLSRLQALGVAAFFHAAQHATSPLLFDARFFTWRLFMVLPFALVVGAAIQRRPSLLPWLMAVHGLLDLSVAGVRGLAAGPAAPAASAWMTCRSKILSPSRKSELAALGERLFLDPRLSPSTRPYACVGRGAIRWRMVHRERGTGRSCQAPPWSPPCRSVCCPCCAPCSPRPSSPVSRRTCPLTARPAAASWRTS